MAAVPVQAAGRAEVVYELGMELVDVVVVVVRVTVTVVVLAWSVTVVETVATHEVASAAGRMAKCWTLAGEPSCGEAAAPACWRSWFML